MAFAIITQNVIDHYGEGDGGNPNAFYSRADIEFVLDQIGAEKVMLKKTVIDGEPCTVLIGVNTYGEEGAINAYDQLGDRMALPCPPYLDENGGRRETVS